ncbi:MAG: DUF4838 domain-containing protein [Bacteroidota bacterium]
MKRSVLVIVVLFMAGLVSYPQTCDLVKRGKGKAVIVVARKDNKTGDTEKAASEIQYFIKKMSGVELPLVKEGTPLPEGRSVHIYVGNTDAAKREGVTIPEGFNPEIRPEIYEEEGYVLKSKGQHVFVGGNGDGPFHGNLYAAYALLEKLGCRWYFPGEWGEVIPEKKSVSLPELDIHSKPDFPLRNIWLGSWFNFRWDAPEREEYKVWAMRVGFSGPHAKPGDMYGGVGSGDGTMGRVLPPAEYAESHPEFYAVGVDGSRYITKETHPGHAALCLSNDEMVAEFIKNLKEEVAGKRPRTGCITETGIGFGPPDGQHSSCHCEKCKALSQNFYFPRYINLPLISEEINAFRNKVAAEFPDRFMDYGSYNLTDMPPQGMGLSPNATVQITPISNCVIHPNNDPGCWRRQEFVKVMKHWRRLSDFLYLYDYNPGMLGSQFEPERDVANFAINAKIYKDIGLVGFVREGRATMMSTWISYYTSAKLMWDVDSHVEGLKKDFYNTFFGEEAGPHIQAWWDACEVQLLKSTAHVHESWLVNHLYTAEFSRSIHKHVEKARKAKMTAQQRERFHAFELIAGNFENVTQMEEAVKNLNYREAIACADRMIAARNELSDISIFLVPKGGQTHRGRIFTLGRKLHYEKLLARTDGTEGDLVAPVPMETKFKRDRFNVGVTSEWYLPGLDDNKWGTENTFYTWDQQDEPEDSAGHDYDGYGWYRFTIDLPDEFTGRSIHFTGEALNEAWVWVNGEYIGHKPHTIWWMSQNDFEMDVTKAIWPGKNTIAIRIWNDAEIGGVMNRGIFWSPRDQ